METTGMILVILTRSRRQVGDTEKRGLLRLMRMAHPEGAGMLRAALSVGLSILS